MIPMMRFRWCMSFGCMLSGLSVCMLQHPTAKSPGVLLPLTFRMEKLDRFAVQREKPKQL